MCSTPCAVYPPFDESFKVTRYQNHTNWALGADVHRADMPLCSRGMILVFGRDARRLINATMRVSSTPFPGSRRIRLFCRKGLWLVSRPWARPFQKTRMALYQMHEIPDFKNWDTQPFNLYVSLTPRNPVE